MKTLLKTILKTILMTVAILGPLLFTSVARAKSTPTFSYKACLTKAVTDYKKGRIKLVHLKNRVKVCTIIQKARLRIKK